MSNFKKGFRLPPDAGRRLKGYLQPLARDFKSVAQQCGVEYTHFCAVLRGGRTFTPALQRSLAQALGLEVVEMEKVLSPNHTLNHAPGSSRDQSVASAGALAGAEEPIQNLLLSYHRESLEGNSREAARCLRDAGVRYRHLGKYREAVRCFDLAQCEYDYLISQGGCSPDLRHERIRNQFFRVWTETQTLRGDFAESLRAYRRFSAELKQLSQECDEEPALDIKVERTGILRRLYEVEYLSGHYEVSCRRFASLVDADPYSGEHRFWADFGQARARFMIGLPEESDAVISKLKHLLWGAKRLKNARATRYVQCAMLRHHLAQRNFDDFERLVHDVQLGASESRRQGIYLRLLKGAMFAAKAQPADSLDELNAARQVAAGGSEDLPLEFESALIDLMESLALKMLRDDAGSEHLAIRAHHFFRAHRCNWGWLRAALLLSSASRNEKDDRPKALRGVDLKLSKEFDGTDWAELARFML